MTTPNKISPASRAVLWIVTLIVLAGWVYAWATTGNDDMTSKVIVTVMIGSLWTIIVFVVFAVLRALGVVGSLLFRGRA